MHATLTARDFFLANFYPPGSFICIFSKTPPEFFLCWLWLTPIPVWACREKKGKTCVIVFVGWHFEIEDIIVTFRERLVCSTKYEVCCVSFFVKYFTERCGLRKKRLVV